MLTLRNCYHVGGVSHVSALTLFHSTLLYNLFPEHRNQILSIVKTLREYSSSRRVSHRVGSQDPFFRSNSFFGIVSAHRNLDSHDFLWIWVIIGSKNWIVWTDLLQRLTIVVSSFLCSYKSPWSPFHGLWQSFVIIGSCSHLRRIISTYVGSIKKWGVMKMMIYVSSGRNHANTLSKIHNQMQGVKRIIILVVGNDKTIHVPTSRDCYFY